MLGVWMVHCPSPVGFIYFPSPGYVVESWCMSCTCPPIMVQSGFDTATFRANAR